MNINSYSKAILSEVCLLPGLDSLKDYTEKKKHLAVPSFWHARP